MLWAWPQWGHFGERGAGPKPGSSNWLTLLGTLSLTLPESPRPQTHTGCVHCRSALCTPTPQLREQTDQALQPDQPPSTASGWKSMETHSPSRHHCQETGVEQPPKPVGHPHLSENEVGARSGKAQRGQSKGLGEVPFQSRKTQALRRS